MKYIIVNKFLIVFKVEAWQRDIEDISVYDTLNGRQQLKYIEKDVTQSVTDVSAESKQFEHVWTINDFKKLSSQMTKKFQMPNVKLNNGLLLKSYLEIVDNFISIACRFEKIDITFRLIISILDMWKTKYITKSIITQIYLFFICMIMFFFFIFIATKQNTSNSNIYYGFGKIISLIDILNPNNGILIDDEKLQIHFEACKFTIIFFNE